MTKLISNSDIVKAAHLQPISKAELAELGRKKPNHNFSQMAVPERECSSQANTAEEPAPLHISLVKIDLLVPYI